MIKLQKKHTNFIFEYFFIFFFLSLCSEFAQGQQAGQYCAKHTMSLDHEIHRCVVFFIIFNIIKL